MEMVSRVLSRAPELAASKPNENISMEDISNASGVSPRTLQKLFKSVGGLLSSLRGELANDLTKIFKNIALENPDYAARVAIKTRLGIRLLTKIPLLGSLLLRVEWHGYDAKNIGLKDIEGDVLGGIKQGRFSEMPTSIGVNIVLSGMKAAVREIIEKRETGEFADRAAVQILIGLGIDARSACELCEIPLPELPSLAKGGLAEKISELRNNPI